VHVIHSDHLNTPRALANAQTQGGQPPGTVVWRWKLNQQTATGSNAFGAQPAEEDPDGNGASVRFDLRFPGQQYDAATGLHYNYYRDYEPGTGRYVESDPVGLDGGINTYVYANSTPLSLVDPQGLNPVAAGAAAGVVALRICMRVPSCKRKLVDLLKEAKEFCDDVRCNLKYDRKPHYFGPLIGYCQHYQINCWLQGKKGSGFSWRTPNLYACRDDPGWVDDHEPYLP
jgi:RHS repeat-associated protein